jgi:malto-oligosyltrehalose trehalohydrolase
MKRVHVMPFGAQLLDGGATRFRLWAPSARRVELVRSQSGARTAMLPAGEGWYQLDLPDSGPGTLYRYRIDDRIEVPDPASRCNPQDVHGPSMVVDPAAFDWDDGAWRGRPWEQSVIYELHVGTFTPQGSFRAVEDKLAHLVDLGVTAIELMPVAECPGAHNWGYDGVLPFAPEARYGTPEELKRLVVAAHRRGLMVFLDVVYNHFGPEGNYLGAYAGEFFTERHRTPWGAAINFDGSGSDTVRGFFLHNALYWLEEYHIDGLRLDAVHAIRDDSALHVLSEIAQRVRAHIGGRRHIHLMLENDANEARYLGAHPGLPGRFDAQWNDDLHHCLHVILTGEQDGYYHDYAERPYRLLGRALAQGFAYQGQASGYRHGRARGEVSAHLPSSAFVSFLQNHDQIGNRALGERIGKLARPEALKAALAVLLLTPQVPLLFMGEEWNAPEPFLFFCDFEPALAGSVREGRRSEFSRFVRYRDEAARLLIPDPTDPATFERSRLDWRAAAREPQRTWLRLYRQLLTVRRREIAPRLAGARGVDYHAGERGDLQVRWRLGDGSLLQLTSNLTDGPIASAAQPGGRLIYTTHPEFGAALTGSGLAPWMVAWSLDAAASEESTEND